LVDSRFAVDLGLVDFFARVVFRAIVFV